ncbi:glycosyltransferase family 9 protein [Methylococcus sp. EFPC2]|uniref:glycosyltransferase family 9 protein n=1 Tax=Methylococcus sp. EFPC2 TaxID=2812648 RepID=UPI00196841CA|nr:glycosyltransferase family 9 protein [Methylococcus sp. EFPC2]QSA96244.1 glycosyltransferase family 9 protein [Methylococcus sp. EFPC2]
MNAPRNILIVRLSAIGDVILASGLIPALRRAYPHARLSWMTEEANVPLLVHNPRLDRVIAWPRRHWRQLRERGQYRQWLGESRSLIGSLRAEHYDLVLDLQGLLKSGVWAWLSGGAVRVGLGSREGSQWLMTRVVDRRCDSPKIGKEYRKLAEALGLDAGDFAMDIVPGPEDEKQAGDLLKAHAGAGSYAVIAPFTTRPQKHWFDERWVELAGRLRDDLGLTVLMLGGPGDKEHAAAIASQVPGLVNLAGHTGLGQCAAIVEKAALAIGVDTGLTHLGIAMKTPTLALFGSTRPYLDTGVANAKVLYEAMDCSPCRRRPTCHGEFHCMKSHTVERVLHEAKLLLEAGS